MGHMVRINKVRLKRLEPKGKIGNKRHKKKINIIYLRDMTGK